jgi:sigma-B regulation protein RsbU (phosphoserine phosphatase)
VQKPYFALSKAQEELKNYAENLDNIVAQRTQELKQINNKLIEDLNYARDIQRSMMPVSFPQEPEVSFESRYYPAERVSGDFYNIFKLDDQQIGLYIGDVSGHGVPAAMLTIFLNQSIKPTDQIEYNKYVVNSPSAVLDHIYSSFNKTNFREDVYMVMFYAIYNFKTRQLTYSSAGLNVVPLVLHASGKVEELRATGFPICKFAEFYSPEYHDHVLTLDRGDRILFYTDGLVEAEGKEKKRYSTTRLKNLIENNHSESIYRLTEIISNDVFSYMDGKQLEDDVTYFMMQIN